MKRKEKQKGREKWPTTKKASARIFADLLSTAATLACKFLHLNFGTCNVLFLSPKMLHQNNLETLSLSLTGKRLQIARYTKMWGYKYGLHHNESRIAIIYGF